MCIDYIMRTVYIDIQWFLQEIQSAGQYSRKALDLPQKTDN